MANIKFGFDQLGKITPEQARWIPRIYTVLSAFVVGFTTNADLLNAHAQNVLNQFVIYFSPVTILIANMFGVTPEPGDGVQITSENITSKK